MPNLILDLKEGDLLVINGAPVRFHTNSSIMLTTEARFLFGKNLMAPDDASTPARRIYFAQQQAYLGPDEERPGWLASAGP